MTIPSNKKNPIKKYPEIFDLRFLVARFTDSADLSRFERQNTGQVRKVEFRENLASLAAEERHDSDAL